MECCFGDDITSLLNPIGNGHADGPNGRDKLRLVVLVMAGLPTPDNNPTNTGQIVQFEAKLITENYSEETISRYIRTLKTLTKRGADITNPESVKDLIAKQTWADGTKQSAVNASMLFFTKNGIQAELPTYVHRYKIPFIPTEAELDQLISGCKHLLASFLQTLKETAARYGEASELKWTDYNTESGMLAINSAEKGSNPRAIKISNKLQIMLSSLPHTTNKIFPYKSKEVIRRNFQRARKRIATNLGNPRIYQIHFHTFRHWKATTEFHKTNNILLVMKLLGHKSLSNTQRYIQLLPDLADDYICEVAITLQEATKLIENGFEYVTEMESKKLFRKRK